MEELESTGSLQEAVRSSNCEAQLASSAHSLRYGGATMLAAAGLPQYIIAWYGGWTVDSTVMRLYATLGSDAINLVTGTMCSQSGKNLSDLIVKQTIRDKIQNKQV